MIEGNYNNQTAYAHTKIINCVLGCKCNWPMTVCWNSADDQAVEVIKSTEELGHWYYWVWAPTPNGNKYLMKLGGWQLFPTAEAASLDHYKQKQQAQLLRYAKCYHHKKKGMFARIKDFLAKKHQAGAPTSSRVHDERKQGGVHPFPAPSTRSVL